MSANLALALSDLGTYADAKLANIDSLVANHAAWIAEAFTSLSTARRTEGKAEPEVPALAPPQAVAEQPEQPPAENQAPEPVKAPRVTRKRVAESAEAPAPLVAVAEQEDAASPPARPTRRSARSQSGGAQQSTAKKAEDLSPSTTGEAAGKTDSPAPAAKKRGRPRATASKVKMSRRRVDEAPATLEPDTAAGPGPALEAQAASPVRVQPDGGRDGPQRGTAPTLDEYAEQGEQGERGGRGPSRLLSPAADPVRPASIALSGAANSPEWTAAGSLEDAGASPSSLPPPETAAAPAVPPAVHHQDESLGSAGASVSAMGDPAAAIGDDSVRGGGAWGEERVPGPTTSTPDAEARSPAAPALPADAPAGRGSGSASPSEAPSPLLPSSTAPEPPSPIRHWEGPPSAVEASPASDPTRDEEPTGRPSVEVALPVAEGQGGPILGTPGEEGPTHAAQTEHDTEDSPASGPAAPDPADAPGGASPSPPAPSPPSPSPSPSPAAPAPPAPRSMAGNLVSAVRSLLPGSRPPAPALSSARPAARLAALEKADAARRAQEARDAERERRRLELERARAERLAAKQAADAEEAQERAEAALRKQQEAAARRKQQLEAGKGGAGPKRKEVALAFGAALPPATADAVPRHASQAAAQQARPALHKPDRENEGPNPSTAALPGAAPTAGAAAVPGAAKPLKKILYNGQQVHSEAGPAKLRLAPAALPQGAQPHGVGLTAGANLQSQGLAPAASRPLLQVWRREGSDEPNQECMPGRRPGLGQVAEPVQPRGLSPPAPQTTTAAALPSTTTNPLGPQAAQAQGPPPGSSTSTLVQKQPGSPGAVPRASSAGSRHNYEISPYKSDDSSDDEEPQKPVPEWARGKVLQAQLLSQTHLDPDLIFQQQHKTCSLDEVFDTSKSSGRNLNRRTSTGNWAGDRLTWQEEMRYKKAMGFA
ncbi:hypothetical protein APUTEX25_003416 [Auxenochlorella protothecoides]|uniref:Inner centromere protein ARK-binding domain-containing protein n=1 Tax=Auxenochlorella protothecoides TaxID=3075 RepID=A0A3M7KUR2_AUXPR|nr:hypothetical protein APUTEX25_003416 [Auxenochlorella protothecoides]|eukprot:RMZ53594.1 hypothetical protein APUTEX25_003416 [Auxenochlorella protothecoides]